MKVKYRGDQAHGENNASRNTPSEFEPDGVKVYLLAEPFALGIATVEIVRKNRENRAEKKLKHGSPLSPLPERSLAVATALEDRRPCRHARAADSRARLKRS